MDTIDKQNDRNETKTKFDISENGGSEVWAYLQEKPSDDPRDIACVRFTADQVMEITSDDYALRLFHLTRICPININEIKKMEPEPERGAIYDTLERFYNVGLLDKLPGGKFYSKFPKNFPNFSNHPEDSELEGDKDARVFSLMKEKAGDREYWSKNTYFSEDGYFTCQQTKYIKEKLQELKFYVKRSLQENNEIGVFENLTFRRHKFYDIVLSFFAVLMICVFPNKSMAGNDPGIFKKFNQMQLNIEPLNTDQVASSILWSKENMMIANQRQIILEGNDPGSGNMAAFTTDDTLTWPKENDPANLWATIAPRSVQIHEIDCGTQLGVVGGDLNKVTMPCVGQVHFATKAVCSEFGDTDFCAVADKIKAALKANTEQ